MRLLRLGLLCLVLLVPAVPGAEPARGFDIDYDLVFSRNAGQVQRPSSAYEQLELPGPVILRRYAQRIEATDQSGWGPAGCALSKLLIATAVARHCPALFDAEELAAISGQMLRGAAFFAANTVPPLSAPARDAALIAALEALAAESAATLSAACSDPQSAHVAFARHLAEPAIRDRYTRIFEQPRLPVSHPCN